MLKGDVTSIRQEIDNAEDFRDSHLEQWRNLISRYHGPAFRKNDDEEDDPENFVHEYIALILPRIVHDNPKIRVKSMRPMVQGIASDLMQVGLNRWCRMTNIRTTLERIATDMLLGFGVGMVVNEPRRGYRFADDSDPYLPRLYRISPDRFFIDPAATSIEDARYMGHCYIVDKEDLLEQAKTEDGWNVELIEGMAENSGIDEIRESSKGDRTISDRGELVIYEVWVPEIRDEKVEVLDSSIGVYNAPMNMFNGTIYTILKHQSETKDGTKKVASFVREPRTYWGPRSGPYEVFGVYSVPDDPYPLSPLVALLPQIDDLNSHLRSMRYSASAYKRVIMVDSRNQQLAKDIQDKDDLFVVLADGIDPSQVVPVEVGGITTQQVTYAQQAQDRLDRVSGIHDAMRGNVSGSATATEISIAEGASGVRLSHIKKQFQESVNRVIRSVAWFMFHDQKIEFPVGEDGIPILGAYPDPVFSARSMVGAFDDLDLQIEAMSMERVSEQMMQRRSLELLQIIGNIAGAVIQAPHVKWDQVLSFVGDAMNIPNLSDMIDVNAGQQMRDQMMAQQAQSGVVRPAKSEQVIQGPSSFSKGSLGS